MHESPTPQSPNGRIRLLDFARGAALLAMTSFHFSWDIEMFGLVAPGFMAQPGMVWYARIIAGSFLFLVGASLVLAHGEKIRWPMFLRRLAMVVAAAGVISLATLFATPDAFIFFGILHSIAVASVLALLFLRLPWWTSALAGMFFLLARDALRTGLIDDPWWWWTGLSQFIPVSNDYEPVFPFFGPVLLGVAAMKMARNRDWIGLLRRPQFTGRAASAIRFIGRHSLVYYLLHQPVMIALLYLILKLAGRI